MGAWGGGGLGKASLNLIKLQNGVVSSRGSQAGGFGWGVGAGAWGGGGGQGLIELDGGAVWARGVGGKGFIESH